MATKGNKSIEKKEKANDNSVIYTESRLFTRVDYFPIQNLLNI